MNTNKSTQGTWKVYANAHEFDISSFDDFHLSGSNIAYLNHDNNRPFEEAEANAALIVSAVNACKEINHANPMAAAEQIFNLYEACVEALSLFDNYPVVRECAGTFEVLNNAVNGALKGYFNKTA